MIPLRDINPTRRIPWVTLALIAVNVVVFLAVEPTLGSTGDEQQAYFLCHAEIPYEVTHQTSLAAGGAGAEAAIEQDYGVGPADAAQLQSDLGRLCPTKSWLWSIAAAMFLHAGWLHIGGNMLYLWIFGDNVEDRLGRVRYLLFYLAGGLAAAALELAVGPNSTVPTLGASGAIASVLGAYLVLYPRAGVRTFVFPFFFVTIPAALVLGIWFLLQVANGAGGLGTAVNGGVAYAAHVGGFLFGLAVAGVFLRRGAPRRDAARGPSW